MKLSTFQLFFLAAMVVITVGGVLVFANHGGVGGKTTLGKVVIWGTVDEVMMSNTFRDMKALNKDFNDVSYVKKNPGTYTDDLVNAMASGKGPDLVILPQDQMLAFSSKLSIVPFSSVSQQSFIDSFIDEGQMFLTADGVRAFPFMVDPLVMYWNRDIFASAGLPRPPQYWSDLLDITPKISVTSGGGVQKSAIALGEWNNVQYAKDIISMLFLQAGDPILKPGNDPSIKYEVTLGINSTTQLGGAPAVSALRFYTEFADPTKTSYSWNNTLPPSQDAFVAGDLGVYLGYSSDYPTLLSRNPNLNFGVAIMPQVKGGGVRMTFGRMLGLAIPRTASNPNGAATIAVDLSSQKGITTLSTYSTLPPVRRDVSIDTSKNAAASVFAQSALITKAWLDPGPAKTDDVFKNMIQSVLSGKSSPQEAVSDASQILSAIVLKL